MKIDNSPQVACILFRRLCLLFTASICLGNGLAQRSSGLDVSSGIQRSSGLQSSGGLDSAKRLDTAKKLDSQSTGFSYRKPPVPPREIFPDVNRVPVLPNNSDTLYLKAKLAIHKAGAGSIHKKDAIGILVGMENRIQSAKPFVMEYSGYLENGEAVYFVPLGMKDPVKLQRYQIISFLAYPPDKVLSAKGPENKKRLEEWIEYAAKKIERQSPARKHFSHLLEEARELLKNY